MYVYIPIDELKAASYAKRTGALMAQFASRGCFEFSPPFSEAHYLLGIIHNEKK